MIEDDIGVIDEAHFSLYIKDDGGCAMIQSPSKIKILNILQNSDATLSQIQKKTKKPLSTIFLQMEQLMETGLVKQYCDGSDGRRKYYCLSSRKIISSPSDERNILLQCDFNSAVDNMVDGKTELYEASTTIVLSMFGNNGISVYEGLYNVGKKIGESIYNKSKFDSIEDFVMFLTEFYQQIGAGKITLYSMMPLTLILTWFDNKSDIIKESWRIMSRGMMEYFATNITGIEYTVNIAKSNTDNKQRCKYTFYPKR